MYGVIGVELAESTLGNREAISITHLIIIKSDILIFPVAVIFVRGCVPQVVMVIPSYAVGSIYIYIYIYIYSGTAVFTFITGQSYDVRKY